VGLTKCGGVSAKDRRSGSDRPPIQAAAFADSANLSVYRVVEGLQNEIAVEVPIAEKPDGCWGGSTPARRGKLAIVRSGGQWGGMKRRIRNRRIVKRVGVGTSIVLGAIWSLTLHYFVMYSGDGWQLETTNGSVYVFLLEESNSNQSKILNGWYYDRMPSR